MKERIKPSIAAADFQELFPDLAEVNKQFASPKPLGNGESGLRDRMRPLITGNKPRRIF